MENAKTLAVFGPDDVIPIGPVVAVGVPKPAAGPATVLAAPSSPSSPASPGGPGGPPEGPGGPGGP